MHIYYLLEKQTAVQQPALSMVKTNSSATSFNMKNHSREQKLHDKRVSRAKKLHCKKIPANSQRKIAPSVHGTFEITLERIKCDIATSKTPRIRVMCVITQRT